MKRMNYYFDYSPESYNYIMSSKILRQSEKNILKDLVEGKKVKEIAVDRKCSYRTICNRRKEIFKKTIEFM
jgi:DNA-binding NarL/FixJ family response regulator